MTYGELFLDYFKDRVVFPHNRSQEYYFGENNPLKTRIISWITHLRDRIKDYFKNHENKTPLDTMPILKEESKTLSTIIEEEFNIEKCHIGWINEVNSECISQCSNADIYGEKENSEKIRYNLNDIVDCKNGFKYKNKEGIIYVLGLGYPIFAIDDVYTVEEAAAVLVHELGHGMQHIVNSINEMIAIDNYKEIYNKMYNYNNQKPSKSTKQKYAIALDSIENEEKQNLYGETILSDKLSGLSYTKINEPIVEDVLKTYYEDWDTSGSDKREQIIQKLEKDHKSVFSKMGVLAMSIWGSLAFLYYSRKTRMIKNKLDSEEIQILKLFEETADNFCQIYGLGVAQASFNKKLAIEKTRYNTSGGMFESLPLLNLFWSYNQLKEEWDSALTGYPTNKQRIANLYKSAKYELQNNKDLTKKQKDELLNQLNTYNDFFKELHDIDSKKGRFYRKICDINKETIDSAADKNSSFIKRVLEPLRKRYEMFKNKQ